MYKNKNKNIIKKNLIFNLTSIYFLLFSFIFSYYSVFSLFFIILFIYKGNCNLYYNTSLIPHKDSCRCGGNKYLCGRILIGTITKSRN